MDDGSYLHDKVSVESGRYQVQVARLPSGLGWLTTSTTILTCSGESGRASFPDLEEKQSVFSRLV